MEAEFARVGIKNVTYVHADAPPSGFTMSNMRRNPRAEMGVGLSHIKAVIQAISDNACRPLFVEDDILFTTDSESRLYDSIVGTDGDGASCFFTDSWSVLYLGGHPREPVTKEAKCVYRVGKFSCAEAYSLHSSALKPFIDYWLDRITKPNAMYDFILGEFAAAHRSYAIYPTITEQRQIVSHVSGTIDDKRALIARGWKTNLVDLPS